jgi:hypothetical protein
MALQVQQNKKALLVALEKSLGVVTTACKNVGLDRTSHYRYLKDDAEYAEAVREIENVALDFAESKLHKQIDKGDTTACIFYLKTKGKGRGYVERSEITGKDGGAIKTENTHDLSKLSTEDLLKLKDINKKLIT